MPWDIGSWELLVLAMIAIIVVGPKELPGMLRTAGQWMSKARGMARQFQRSFDELAKESELDELRKGVNELKNGGPIGDIKKEIEDTIDPIKKEFGDYDPTATKATPVNGSGQSSTAKPPKTQAESSEAKTPESSTASPAKTSEPDADVTKTKTSA